VSRDAAGVMKGGLFQTRLYARPFFISDEEEMAKFERLGGHANPDKSGCGVVGNTTRWVMELLLAKKATSR